MLYEVITLMRYPEIGDAGDIYSVVSSPLFPEQLPLKELNEVTKIEEWLKRLVITSYSIHYTKLYEIGRRCLS